MIFVKNQKQTIPFSGVSIVAKTAHKTSIRGQNSSRDHEFSALENQSEIIPELQVDGNDHNLASDDAQGGPDSPKVAWH